MGIESGSNGGSSEEEKDNITSYSEFSEKQAQKDLAEAKRSIIEFSDTITSFLERADRETDKKEIETQIKNIIGRTSAFASEHKDAPVDPALFKSVGEQLNIAEEILDSGNLIASKKAAKDAAVIFTNALSEAYFGTDKK